LIGLLIGSVALAHLPTRPQIKLTIVTLGLLLGLGGLWFKHAVYFSKGATSASARTDYWKVAMQIIQAKPIFGSGPGTFFREYGRLKPPEAEMARLAHNDYLQQGADSGIPGLLTYSCIWIGSLAWLYRKSIKRPLTFGVWLGLTGLALHSLVEFGLYIPATSWLHFTLLGWLLAEEARPEGMTGNAC
jgi:O-antigen ligase